MARIISLFLERDGASFWGNYLEDHWLELLGRPRQEGKTEDQMLECVRSAAECVADRGQVGYPRPRPQTVKRRIKELREALDVYELGLPLKEEKPQRNESFVDRHMTP